MRPSRRVLDILIALAIATAGSRGQAGRPVPPPTCPAIDSDAGGVTKLPANFDPASLAGDYVLSVVADSGPRRGRRASGRLALRPMPSEQRAPFPSSDLQLPLYGWSDISFRPVGISETSTAPASRDTARPGVYAKFNRRARTLDLTVGGYWDMLDGSEVIMLVHGVAEGRVWGRWFEASQRRRAPRGRFCLERTGAPAS